jgi:hypothetical protein
MQLAHLTQSGKRKLAGGLLATTLALTGGIAIVGAQTATPTPAANTAVKMAGTSACTDITNRLATNLGIDVGKLQTAEKATINQTIDARLAANKITPQQAQAAHDKVNSSADVCTLKVGAKGAAGKGAGKHAKGMLRKDELQAAAKEFNIIEQQLTQDLKSGKSLADEAAAHNVKTDDLKATLRATLKADLDKAVASKAIDQAKEDKALAAFDAHADALISRHAGQKAKQ